MFARLSSIQAASGEVATWVFGAALVLSAQTSMAGYASAVETGEKPILVIGSVEEDVQEEQGKFGPFRAFLAQALAPHGIGDVKLKVHTSINEISTGFNNGTIDLYIDSPILTAIVARQSNAKAFLRSWKEGVPSYTTLIYVRDDSPLQSAEDLIGHRIGFKKRESTPGYFLPRSHLDRAGLPLVELVDPSAPTPLDRVGYVFTYGDQTTLAWVMTGKVDAGVMKNSMIDEPQMSGVRDQLRVLVETYPLPRQVLARRGDMDPALVAVLHQALTAMHEDEAGRAALDTLDETARFDDFPEGADQVFPPIWRSLDFLEAENTPAAGR